ncbi:hypothetical protein SpCBS45565_g01373 [Spizellomyces sp. 'palustris']|nr:hypothetical protein SpCBS45565_g01373 [Spizellomyces sp. 'palustris']
MAATAQKGPAPRTFSLQSKLARLPIPPLEETAERYLQTLRPVLSQEEFAHSEAAVREFIKPGGLGHTLQQRLLEHDKNEPNSWLERWWLRLAYHSWREGLMVNSNWYMLGRDHPETPKELITEKSSARKNGQYTGFQLRRAAGLITNLLDYKNLLDTETLPVDMTRAGPQDMNQYRHIFGITRVPKAECDVNVGSHPTHAKHVVVLVRDQIYAVDVYDANNGERVSITDIEKQLKTVVQSVTRSKEMQPPIGLFTAIHRDKWAEMHKHLEDLSAVNRESFKTIETALFAVSLDDYCLPLHVEYLAKNTFHAMNGHNRWFDKSISVCMMNDGRTGVNGEHSPCDALVPALMVDYLVQHEPARDPPTAKSNPVMRHPRLLTWQIDAKITEGLKEAKVFIEKTIADSDVRILHYSGYGSDLMKKSAKVSPDAYMQMALQLAFYRLHGKCAAVYETASTRQFLHGRTETCRSLSSDSKAFVEAFDQRNVSAQEKYNLLQKACTAHVKYLSIAGQGRGVDRHLLGLRMCMKDGESAEIFKDPAYGKSSYWQLSTSGLFPGDRILGTGFGAVYPDGYGMNYMIASKVIKIGVESKCSCKETSSGKYIETLASVLTDIAQMCVDVNGTGDAKAKL